MYSASTAVTDCTTTSGTSSVPATCTYDPGNELTSLAAGARSATGTLTGTLTYDENGSTLTGPGQDGGAQRTHQYNERDQERVLTDSVPNTYAGAS